MTNSRYDRTPTYLSPTCLALLLAAALIGAPAFAGAPINVTFEDVNPDQSDTDPSDPDGATGGRVNGLAIHPSNNQIMYAASEWGGIYSSADGGLNWARFDGHLPVATWDVEIDPSSTNRLYATSFFDGKLASQAGINVSTDSGATWAKPATAVPPSGFCTNATDEVEPSAFGISIDPSNSANVYIGTNCGLALSTDSGVTWSYRDPGGPMGSATRVWDVLALGGGVVHVCGDEGSFRSDDGGTTWIAGSGLAAGRCSLAVSPDESYVLLSVVGTSIYETQNGGAAGGPTWAVTRSNPTPQGRIPFVATNQRSAANSWDLWFGDVSLFRVGCTTPTPPLPGGAPRCGTGNTPPWAGGFTRNAGGHDDTGAILFDSQAANDACPVLFSSDGGVYYNTDSTSDCHNPDWEQPDVTPHGLWPWAMSGADQARTGQRGSLLRQPGQRRLRHRRCRDGDAHLAQRDLLRRIRHGGGVGRHRLHRLLLRRRRPRDARLPRRAGLCRRDRDRLPTQRALAQLRVPGVVRLLGAALVRDDQRQLQPRKRGVPER